jgi:uncharacterized membrane protein
MIILWISLLPPLFIIAGAFALAPVWRRTYFFSAAVAPEFRNSAAAAALLARHRARVLIAAVAAAVISASALYERVIAPAVVMQFALIAFSMWSYYQGWRAARAHSAPPSTIRMAPLAAGDDGLLGAPAAWLAPFLILGAAAIALAMRWDVIPSRVVAHWGPSGPNRWVEKSWRAVYGVLIIGAWAECLVTGIGLAIARGARRSTGGWRASNRTINLAMLLAISYLLALTFADIALAPAFGDPARLPVSIWIPAAALLGAVALGFWRMFQTRSEPDVEPETVSDDKWTWGEFYYNPDDPAVAVPKRSGAGCTLNLASPFSWLIGAIILLLPAIIIFLAV